jgi:serine/threonine protein kinase
MRTTDSNRSKSACGEIALDVLLYGDEDSAEFRRSAEHVESCPECCDRLSRLAGSDAEWAEARDTLRSDADSCAGTGGRSGSVQSAAERGSSARLDHVRLDFLSPPSHPEMLGRLGRYEIEQVIGSGGMGIVLKGFDGELNRPVAIKVLAPHLAFSGAARQRFAREARAAAAVVHPHVVAIHNVETEQEVPFLVMQFVPGRSLQDRVDRDGPLTPAEILRIGLQAAAGLAAAHTQGVIHRDVKPANILLEDDVERALLTDFGLARAADDARLTHSGIVAGTPHYMSPEQASGDPVDARSDLFSLGSVLYFMATGHPPFRAERAMAVLNRICRDRHRPVCEANPNIPDELADVIDRLLEKKPGRRFAAASDLQAALERVLSRLQQPGVWRARNWWRRMRRHRGSVFAGAGVVAAVFGMIWVGDWLSPHRALSPSEGPSPRKAETNSSVEAMVLELDRQSGLFNRELGSVQDSLLKVTSQPYPETILLSEWRESWLGDLNAARAAAARLERAWLVEGDAESSRVPSKGANP